MAEAKNYRTVTAPLVVVRLNDGTSRYLARGDVLLEDVSKESVDNLDSLGFLSAKQADAGPADARK